jgi:hypothetical protein
VADQVNEASYLLDGRWRLAVADAAWLHDVGYSPHVTSTGFHPLDGARWLRDRDWPMATCRLVAWHTNAWVEGSLRGLDHELAVEFEPPPEMAANVLAWADLTSSPTGEEWSVGRRVRDILSRYPADSIEHRAVADAASALRRAAREVESRLGLEIEDR